MPARDFLHNAVITALTKDDWTITDDPFTIAYGARRVYADLGAERLLAAQKGTEKIVVEVKSFVGLSRISELECALGQFLIYRSWLSRIQEGIEIFIALDESAYIDIFEDISGEVLLEDYDLKLIVIDGNQQRVLKWIS